MAPPKDNYSLTALKAVTYRIQSTPPKTLPSIVPHLTAVLPSCKSTLSAPQNPAGKDASEAAVLVHKFRTQLSTLLQDRSVEGRWSAVVLVKSAIELGGWEMLQKSKPWVLGLLNVLSKNDPSTTKILAIVTLTRIFMLTREYQTLVREITTPSLAPFITKCMNIVTSSKTTLVDSGAGSLVSTVFESFAHLITRHPTIFRTHCSHIKQALGTFLANGSSLNEPTEGMAAARRLYVQLSCCAPKNGAQGEWEKTFNVIVSNTHQIADRVFRAVVEEWESVTNVQSSLSSTQVLDDEPQQLGPDLCGFPAWSGIYPGSDRLIEMLHLLQAAIGTSTASGAPVNIKIAHIMDLLTRILSVTAPGMSLGRKNHDTGMALNDQIGKEERNALWIVLPEIHATAIDLFETVVERFGNTISPVLESFHERLVFLFQEERLSEQVRAATYRVLKQVLPIIGSTLTAAQVKSLSPVMISCCDDLLPRDKDAASAQPAAQKPANGAGKAPQATMNADTFLGSTARKPEQLVAEETRDAAWDSLHVWFTHLPVHLIENSMRSRIESTAVLLRHKATLLASILNMSPTKNTASLLPLLARMYPEAPEAEALLRPRMPVIKKGDFGDVADEVEDEEVDEESEEEEAEDKANSDVEMEGTDNAQAGASDEATEEKHDASVADLAKTIAPEQQFADQALTAAASAAPVEVTTVETGRSKRASVDPAPRAPSPKRARFVESSSTTTQGTAPAVSETTTVGTVEDDEDEDDDVEIPTLVMDDDEDESEGDE